MSEEVTNKSITQSMNIFMAERSDEDLDLVLMVKKLLTDYFGVEVADNFYNDVNIQTVLTSMPEVQRVIINRYFTTAIFRFRFHNQVDVIQVLSNLISDGTYHDWIYLFRTYVIPFLKEHNVLSFA